MIAGVTAPFQGVVEIAEYLSGLDINGVLLLKFVLLVAGDEGEGVDVAMEIGERKFGGGDAGLVEQRQVTRVFGFQIVQGDAGKVGDDDVAGDVASAFVIAGEVLDVAEGLGARFAEVFAEAFVFDDEDARPEEVDVAVVAGDFFDGILEAGDGASANAEDLEELVPKALGLGFFASFGGPFAGELNCVMADFVPANGHGDELKQFWQIQPAWI